MIVLNSGALIDKSFSNNDFTDGSKYSPRLGLIETFNPCALCKNLNCKRTTYTPCIKEYKLMWLEWTKKNQ